MKRLLTHTLFYLVLTISMSAFVTAAFYVAFLHLEPTKAITKLIILGSCITAIISFVAKEMQEFLVEYL